MSERAQQPTTPPAEYALDRRRFFQAVGLVGAGAAVTTLTATSASASPSVAGSEPLTEATTPPSDTFSQEDLISRFPPGTVIGTPEFNRIAAENSMIDFFAKQDPTCVDRYFKAPYINHNTRAKDGLEPVRVLAQQATTWQGVHILIRRALAEGDLVVLQSVYSNLNGGVGQFVVFDMFRFDNGKIVEHWDCLQAATAPDASGLGQVEGPVDIITKGQHKEANRSLVLRYIDQILIQGRTAHLDHFIEDKDYVEHSVPRDPGLNRDKGRFVPVANAAVTKYVKTHKTIAEGNFVLVQGEGRIGDTQVLEIYDLFRLDRGKIVEHWDVLQPLAPEAQWANPNGPF
jgi:predicted SnoaL-like aldol condensation-catalyzing enzyme